MESNKNMKSPRKNILHHHHHHHHHQHHHHPSLPSPRNSHNANSINNNNGGLYPQPPSPSVFTQKPITRSESGNPYPTTFVQADVSSFKQVVQMLTGSTETVKRASSNYSKPPIELTSNNNKSNNNNQRNHIPPIKTIPKKHNQQSGFKLYERRNSLKNFHLNPLLPVFTRNSNPSGFSPRNPDVLSPSVLDFPSLVLSPVTPLIPDPFNRSTVTDSGNGCHCGNPILNSEAEDKAIKEKGFFLHPSPRNNTPRGSEPKLLPLFPTTSPKASVPSSSSTSSSSSST